MKRTRILAALAALALAFALVPAPVALAMTTNKATARPNATAGGSTILGGAATRLTWEGTVEEGEELAALHLIVPADGSFDGSTTAVTVLEGLTRIPTESTAQAAGTELTVSFPEPIGPESLVRIECTGMCFPSAGGDYVISGSYVLASGEELPLADSKPITITANTPLQKLVDFLDEQAWVQAWNSVPFLNMFLKPQLIVTAMASLFPGWVLCLAIVLCSYPFAILLGLVFAFMRISKNPLVRGIASVYVNLLRGTPQFLQIYIAFFGLPMMGINVDNTLLGGIVVAINSSAYLAEIFRAGIESIPAGQYEAAESLGMSHMQTMLSIILPQTIRRVIPTVVSDFITNYKDTSLLSSVGVMELMMFAKNLTAVNGNMTPYMAAAVYYLLVTLPLVKVLGTVEARMAASERGGNRPKGDAGAASDQAINTAAASSGAAGLLPAEELAAGAGSNLSTVPAAAGSLA